MYKNLLVPMVVNVPFMQSQHVFRFLNTTSASKSHSKDSMEPRYDFNRGWATTTDKQTTENSCSFKLISYNILAQDLLVEHLQLYLKIDQEWLIWRRRLQNIHREIVKLNPDILCLQEMQYNHLAQLVQSLSKANGKRLEYVYKKKTGSRTDGCAIIYDSSKFEVLAQRGLELYTPNVAQLNRENVALFAKFKLKETQLNKEVIVATTHLLYNPRREDVRCAQVMKLMDALHEFAVEGDIKNITPVILTGDFNSTKDSLPIALLTDKRTNAVPLQFEKLNMGEFSASTHQNNWITVDYILRSACAQCKHKLQVRSVYTLPTVRSCHRVGPIPNHYLGSDHYALGAVFALH